MKKIVFLHTSLERGGAEVMRLVLLRNIDKKRYDIKVYCIGEKGILGCEIERMGYEVHELKEKPGLINLCITYKLIKCLKKERPDILHSSLFRANFHARLAGLFCRVPHIITEEHGEHREYKGIKFLPYILADFFLSRVNDFVICCSERLKDDIIKKERLPRNKVIAIDNSLDAKMYNIKISREAIRKKYNIKDEIVFIIVASLKSGKGHHSLTDAFREVKESGYKFKCFFAGDGPLKDELYKRCLELGLSEEIIFLGSVDNTADYLSASEVFVLPSFSEGLSIALMEAMFMGLGCIVTDVGSNPDLVKTGHNGIVIKPQDKEGLKNAIIFYFNNKNLIKEFGERSMSIAQKYTDMDKYAGRYCEIWDKCD